VLGRLAAGPGRPAVAASRVSRVTPAGRMNPRTPTTVTSDGTRSTTAVTRWPSPVRTRHACYATGTGTDTPPAYGEGREHRRGAGARGRGPRRLRAPPRPATQSQRTHRARLSGRRRLAARTLPRGRREAA